MRRISAKRNAGIASPRCPRSALFALGTAAGVSAAVAAVQLRHGIVPLLDTVTYWSGAEAVADGRLFSTSLAPSFSNFDAVEFLNRGGRLPFVDFPVAYPLIAGLFGLAMGTHAAMHILTIVAMAAIAGAIVGGALVDRRSSSTDGNRTRLAVVFASLVPFLPAMRLVTQGTLSEPLFIASVLLFVVTLTRFRQGGSWAPVVALVITGSLLRFLGAPLALLAGWEHFKRDRRPWHSVAWTAAMLIPSATNIVLAASAGGGHSAGWRGLDRVDIEVFVRSVGGWFDAIQGDIRRTYFTTDGPSWWSWPLTAVVLVTMALGVIGVLRRSKRSVGPLTDAAQLALAAAAILTVGLIAGILGFDALVIADNRLMLPVGVLVISAGAWTLIDRLPDPAPRRTSILVFASILLWGVAAVRPWNVLERFSDIERPLAMSSVVADLDIDAVISNDADGVHWDTGIPAAYAPMSIKPLTGESVDDVAVYEQMPCPLLRARAAVVISNEATFSTVNRRALDDLVASGRLRSLTSDAATVYLPTDYACDG